MSDVKFGVTVNNGLITFSGNMNSENTVKTRKVLIKALIHSDDVGMDFNNITSIGFLSLQILCSAHRSAVRLNKKLAFTEGGRPEIFIKAAEAAGFMRSTGCGLDCGKGCLWLEG